MNFKDQLEISGRKIVHTAYEVHRELGPGLLESVYKICQCEELVNQKLSVEQHVNLPVIYKGNEVGKELFIDILFEKSIIIN
jgi:GxxExxY protein